MKIEAMRRNTKIIPQCQALSGVSLDIHKVNVSGVLCVCVKCVGGKHPTKECQIIKIKEKPKCVNCRGEHPASL